MLRLHLRDLDEHGVINRIIYPQVPPKVEYLLTGHGRAFEPILEMIHEGGLSHLKHMEDKKVQILPEQR